MALSTRKKNIMIADWKAGRFPSAYALAKAHKVSDKTATKLIKGIPQENIEAVEAGVKYEMAKKSVKNPIEQTAIERVVKEKTKEERMKDAVLDNVLKISVHTTTAAAKLLQDNSTSKNKMEGNEILTLQKVAKEAKATVVDKEEKTVVENNLNMQQMVLSQEETNIEVTVVDLDSEELVQLFKDRNLPI